MTGCWGGETQAPAKNFDDIQQESAFARALITIVYESATRGAPMMASAGKGVKHFWDPAEMRHLAE